MLYNRVIFHTLSERSPRMYECKDMPKAKGDCPSNLDISKRKAQKKKLYNSMKYQAFINSSSLEGIKYRSQSVKKVNDLYAKYSKVR